MTKLEQLRKLVIHLRRNYPQWPGTFNPCANEGCKKLARGDGKCADCCEKELAEFTDDPILAAKLHHHILEESRILRVWLDTVK